MNLDAVPREVLLGVAGASTALVVVQSVARALTSAARRRAVRARGARAVAGERQARAMLEAHGYAITAAQVSTEYALAVDGASVAVRLRADYLVTRDGARFVAEVKTGDLAPSLATAATRRQLLEYAIAFDADGVLLVDAESGRVHDVTFPLRTRDAPRGYGGAWVALVALVVVLAWIGLASGR